MPFGRRTIAGVAAVAVVSGLGLANPARAENRKPALTSALTAALTPATSPVAADAVIDSPTDGLLVRFDASASKRAVEVAVAAAGGTVEDPGTGSGFVKVSTGSTPVAAVQAALAASPVVDLVEPNRIRQAAALPSDPRYASQASYLDAIHLPEAWNRVTGNDAMVLAVIDSGVQRSHPDLAGRLVPGWDFVDDDPNPDDGDGHGTMVAGIAAASTNNATGVAGATWAGRIMPLRVLRPNALGELVANDADIAAAIRFAVDNNADVINLSLGSPGASDTLQRSVDYAVANNVVVVAAAGNSRSTERNYPAACTGVVAVGAVDTTAPGSPLASFSNRGPWVTMVAPGVSITTTTRTTTSPGSGYEIGSGTSFSSPLVAAAAFLLRAADPSATAQSIVARLTDSATDLGAPGRDDLTGAGLLNVFAALDVTNFSTASSGSGYWMVASDGGVYKFGGASFLGSPRGSLGGGQRAVDLEPTPTNSGYWIADSAGNVYDYGDAGPHGSVAPGTLLPGETLTSISATPSGNGYWLFSTLGRVFPFGDARWLGDLRNVRLNGGVLDSVPTPTGRGYYMVASDGGIFAFGDARFVGSMGATRLNAPVQSLVPDPDGAGYWLVAADGGVFAFDAPFRGSTGGVTLNAPVTGMVPYGNGYLMVATDGGAFNFSNLPFSGSLGASTPAQPIVAVAATR